MFWFHCSGLACAASKVKEPVFGSAPGGAYSRSTLTQATGPVQSANARTPTLSVAQNGSSSEILRTYWDRSAALIPWKNDSRVPCGAIGHSTTLRCSRWTLRFMVTESYSRMKYLVPGGPTGSDWSPGAGGGWAVKNEEEIICFTRSRA